MLQPSQRAHSLIVVGLGAKHIDPDSGGPCESSYCMFDTTGCPGREVIEGTGMLAYRSHKTSACWANLGLVESPFGNSDTRSC